MTVKITGVDEVNDLLDRVAPRVGLNIMRSTIHGIAGDIAKDAKTHMSEDTGTMKKATKPKRERIEGTEVSSTVRVNKAAFYWRFREYGQGPDGVEDAMFMKAVSKFRAKFDVIFREKFGKKYEVALARAAKKAG